MKIDVLITGPTATEHLAKVMLKVGLDGGEQLIYENREMLKISP
jgi:hypothetical protein